jgi:hypothetical protein
MSERAKDIIAILECPCCGDDGAISDGSGLFYDGQVLCCGCKGWVTVDEDDVWINVWDCDCPVSMLFQGPPHAT